MKKILYVSMLIILTACSITPLEKDTPLLKLIDPSKDFLYAENADDLDLEYILSENGKQDDYETLISIFDNALFENTSHSDLLKLDKIIINIDSDEARDIEDSINKDLTNYTTYRQTNTASIKNNEPAFSWAARNIFETYSSNDTKSFMTFSITFTYPGEYHYTMNAYAFDSKTGVYLTNQSRLEQINMTLDQIIKIIETDFEEIPVQYGSQMVHRKLNQELETGVITDAPYYQIQEKDGIVITDDAIHIILNQYSDMFGGYVSPIIYTINR